MNLERPSLVDALTPDRCHKAACFFSNTGDVEAAEQFFRHGLILDPKHADNYAGLAALHLNQNELAGAKHYLEEAIRHNAQCATAWFNLGMLKHKLNQFEEARHCLSIAQACSPPFPDVLWCAISLNSQYRDDYTSALAEYRKALDCNPSNTTARMSLGITQLLTGQEMREAWWNYEARMSVFQLTWACGHNCIPIWNIQPRKLSGSAAPVNILAIAEQGTGDTFMFARYGKTLKYLYPGAKIGIYTYNDALKEPLQHWPGWDEVWCQGDGQVPSHYDVQLALMSVPLLLALEGTDDYIRSPVMPIFPNLVSPGDQGFKIGICWKGNKSHPNDRYRSIPYPVLRPLVEQLQKNYTVYSFQQDEEVGLPTLPLRGWVETAQSLSQMDLLLSVDTATAHLASTMGIETWVLLSKHSDWRWTRAGNTTPWYPSMKFFRQSKLGDWSDVLVKIGSRLL